MKWKSKLAALLLMLLLVFSPGLASAQNFIDIESHWAEDNLIRSLELGWIQGDGTNKLEPDRPMSRAEFIIMAYRSLGLENISFDGPSNYTDISDLAWAEDILIKLDRVGILSQVFIGDKLKADQEITREEAVALLDIVNTYKKLLNNGVETKDAIELAKSVSDRKAAIDQKLTFKDKDEITDRFATSIVDFYNQGIVTGYKDGRFGPKEPLTRAQAISLLLRTLGEEPQEIILNEVQIIQREGKSYLVNPANGEEVKRSQAKGGRVKINGQVYLIGQDSSLKEGIFDEKGETYYADAEKGLACGWKEIEGKYYYFSPMDNRMYKDGIFSTGKRVYWFGKDGAVCEGNRAGGSAGLKVYWHYPSQEELSNKWLEGPDQDLRFRGQEIANFAASFEGRPFKWYGDDLRDPGGVYCVGNTYSAYKEFGIRIPGTQDVNKEAHNGYELTRAQYEWAADYGGEKIPADFDKIWPGDLVFLYSPNFYLGYNHVGIYMGKNNGRPFYIHSALKNGLAVEDPYKMINEYNRKFNENFIRYNTSANPGNGIIPKR